MADPIDERLADIDRELALFHLLTEHHATWLRDQLRETRAQLAAAQLEIASWRGLAEGRAEALEMGRQTLAAERERTGRLREALESVRDSLDCLDLDENSGPEDDDHAEECLSCYAARALADTDPGQATPPAAAHRLARLRSAGWTVAVHNDYRLNGKPFTFWLFTHEKSGRFAKGEGATDDEALAAVEVMATAGTGSDDDVPTATCPRCKAEVPDHDGFGVLAHLKPVHPDGCGYCSHPSRDGQDDGTWKCGICGDVRP
jgi:hypothetical protein